MPATDTLTGGALWGLIIIGAGSAALTLFTAYVVGACLYREHRRIRTARRNTTTDTRSTR